MSRSAPRGMHSAGRNRTDSGLRVLLQSLRALGVTALGPRLTWLAFWSFVSGVAQAGVLVILSDVAVNSAQGRTHFKIGPVSVSSDQALIIAVCLVALFAAAGIIAAVASSSMSAYALQQGRDSVIDAFFGASWAVQSEERLGQVQQLLTVNSERLGLIMVSLANGLQSLLNLLALLLVAFIVSPPAAAAVLALGIVLFMALRPFNTWTRRAAGQMTRESRRMATTATEYTRLTREFRLLGVEERATEQLHAVNEEAALSFRKTRRLGQMLPTIYVTIALLFVLIGLAFVSRHGTSNLASIGAVLLLILRSLTYGAQVQGTSQQFREFGVFIDDLREHIAGYMRDSHMIRTKPAPPSFNINCNGVYFSYDGKTPVLKDVSFDVPDGQIVGVIGRSGSGKTTLAQLLLGMRSPGSGEMLVGGVRPSDLLLSGGTSPMALVAQDPVLLQGSIEFNVSFFRDVSRSQIEEACKAAHFHEDIMAMPDAYATSVGEGGGAMSGGQRQRLAIARALVGSPRLLVLDEPTSALDGRSERLIRQTLDELRGRMTVVVISHRLITVDICDLLLVLENGNLVDRGPSDVVRSGDAFKHVTATMAQD